MNISIALQGIASIFLDTAPIIYLVEKNPDYLDRIKDIFQRVDAGQLSVVTSPITLAECLVYPLRLGLNQLCQDFIDVVVNGTGTTFISIEQKTGETAAQLRAKYNLKLPDSLQLAAALNANCDAFLTNDSKLKRVTELQVLVLDDLSL
ncbi:MAG: type II toxin-antitoxin system VapC family toxin [Blastocatellales bacterium]